MKKSVLILGLFLSTMLTATTKVDSDSLRTEEDLPTMMNNIKNQTDILKVKWVKIQYIQNKNKDLKSGIKFLKELTPMIQKMERKIVSS